jgi:hypothetical protein
LALSQGMQTLTHVVEYDGNPTDSYGTLFTRIRYESCGYIIVVGPDSSFYFYESRIPFVPKKRPLLWR